MKYFIKNSTISKIYTYEVNETEYSSLINARETLFRALSIEEKYDLLTENYIEFELEILRFTTIHSIKHDTRYMDRYVQRNKLNQRLVNLLTSARLYIDQTKRILKKENLTDVELIFSDAYDSSPEYRFMESIRNHVQHKELPIHVVTNRSSRLNKDPENLSLTTTTLISLKSELEHDKNIKTSILDRLPKEIDLAEQARGYIENLNKIHLKIRSITEIKANLAREHIEKTIEKHKKLCAGEDISLVATAEDDGGKAHEKHSIFLDWDDVRIELSNKNGTTGNLMRKVLSNRRIE